MAMTALLPLDLDVSADVSVAVLAARVTPQQFSEPFFVDTLAARFSIPVDDRSGGSEAFIRPLIFEASTLPILSMPAVDFVRTAAQADDEKLRFIFHMSRCGSTLATQLLAQVAEGHVISEAHIINRILSPLTPLPRGLRSDLLRASIGALQGCRPSTAAWTCIKFRSWNCLFARQILDICPRAPWVFSHRDGLEVMASVLASPPGCARGIGWAESSRQVWIWIYPPFELPPMKTMWRPC
jgi:hypothetical protein